MKRIIRISFLILICIFIFSSCGKKNKVIIVNPVDPKDISLTENKTEITESYTESTVSEDYSDNIESESAEEESSTTELTETETSSSAVATTKAKFTVTLIADGIEGYPKSYTVTGGETLNLPGISKTGYTFDGWYSAKSGGNKYTSSTRINDNTTLYAQWSAKKYVVTLINDGSVYDTVTVNYDSTAPLPSLTNSKYDFVGWYTEDGEKYTSSTRITHDVKLYSKWTLKEFTVSFNSNGGTPSYNAIKVPYGYTINLLEPTREGYDFVGWYDSKSDGNLYTSSTKITSNVTLYAHWSAKSYTVSFDSTGGSPSYNSVSVKYGSTVNLPSPAKEGYNFSGWYTSASGGEQYTSSTKITKNVTLYAHWTKRTCTVKYDSDGGTSYSSQKVDYGTTITLPTPQKAGYTFNGWYTAKTGGIKYGSSIKITSDVTFYAQWSQNSESDWVDSVPADAIKTQTRTVYRYRTRSEEPVYTTKKQYQYAYYACNRCGTRWYGPCYHSELGSSCSGYISGPYTAWFDFAPLTTVNWRTRTGDGSVYSFNTGSGDYFYTTNTHTALYQYMKIRETRVQTGTQYTSWGSWSNWSTTNPGASTNLREVESKTQYKYRKK